MSDSRVARGMLDTSVIIDIEKIERSKLPIEIAVSTLTMAELAAGPHATSDPNERAKRQDRLQRTEAIVEPSPFDSASFRAYGRIYASVASSGRKARGPRLVDLLIASTACALGLPLYTRNAKDFQGVEHLVQIVEI